MLASIFAQALATGRRPAEEALADVAAALGKGIFMLAKTLDPELIALGGGVSALGQPLLGAVCRAVSLTPGMRPPIADIPIVLARHRNDAGALGAALLAATPGHP